MHSEVLIPANNAEHKTDSLKGEVTAGVQSLQDLFADCRHVEVVIEV